MVCPGMYYLQLSDSYGDGWDGGGYLNIYFNSGYVGNYTLNDGNSSGLIQVDLYGGNALGNLQIDYYPGSSPSEISWFIAFQELHS